MMRGIDSRNEIDPTMLLRDTRTLGQRFGHFIADPTNVSIILVSLAGGSYYLPEATLITLILGSVVFFYAFTRKQMLPFRLPQIAHVKDFNDLKPGIKTPNMSRGIA